MDLAQKIGVLIQQYGSFSVNELSVQKGERLLPSGRYQVSLKQSDSSLLPLVTIPTRHFGKEQIIGRIHSWLQGQSHQIALATQCMIETQESDAIEKFQALVHMWKTRYDSVLQALREIDPSTQIEEEPKVKYLRNVSYRLVDGKVIPVAEAGTLSRDYGSFRIYEVHEFRNGEALPLSHDVCFIAPDGDVRRIGNTSLPEMSLSALISFLHSFLALQEQSIQRIKNRLLTATNPELVLRLQKILSSQEDNFSLVLNGIEDLGSARD